MPAVSRFRGLHNLLKGAVYVSGDADLFWGGHSFKKQEDFPRFDYNISSWFLAHTVPFMTSLILEMPELFRDPLPLLKSAELAEQEVVLSKRQCGSLLAVMFFCGYHHTSQPQPLRSKRDGSFHPLVNYDSILLCLNQKRVENQCVAKVCMLMNYFERSRISMSKHNFSIKRLRSLHPLSIEQWKGSEIPLTNLKVLSEGGIHNAGPLALHVDFANKFIGGGVMRRGSVQEEIMFSVCPELLVSLIFCERMMESEAILLTGAEMFSNYTGYSSNTTYDGNCPEEDIVSRIAIDAISYRGRDGPMNQYRTGTILRELNKAYVGFNHNFPATPGDEAMSVADESQDLFNDSVASTSNGDSNGSSSHNSPVATGNWGCGAFGGHIQLKSMLQWCAAALCGREVLYYTFKDPNAEGLEEISELLMQQAVTVGKLSNLLITVLSE